MNTLVPSLFPVITVAAIVLFPRCVTFSLVPLHSPLAWSMFLISRTWNLTLSFNRWFGILKLLIPLRNSVVNHSLWTSEFSSYRQTKSELKYFFSSHGIIDIIYSLTCSTESSVGAIIPLSWKNSGSPRLSFKSGYTESISDICNTPFSQHKNFLNHLSEYSTKQRDITSNIIQK